MTLSAYLVNGTLLKIPFYIVDAATIPGSRNIPIPWRYGPRFPQ
jgi:hypothetical protein